MEHSAISRSSEMNCYQSCQLFKTQMIKDLVDTDLQGMRSPTQPADNLFLVLPYTTS